MKQRIEEQTEVRRIAGIEIGQAVTVIAEAGKIVIVKEEK